MRLLIVFIFSSLTLCAQRNVSGKVFDKETGEPVPNVVVLTDKGSRAAVTDEKGRYSLQISSSNETVHFKHLAYQLIEIQASHLFSQPDVYLIPDAIALSEVVVSPLRADELLKKAAENLMTRFETGKNNLYLFHLDESTSLGGEREAYALVDISLSRISKRLGTFSWNLNLLQLDRTEQINKEDFYVNEKQPFWIEFFPKRGHISNKNNFIYAFHKEDDEQFIIKASPKRLNRKHYRYQLYTINKTDTTLTEMLTQSYTNASELTFYEMRNKTKNWQTTNHFSNIRYAKDKQTGLYHLEKLVHSVGFKVGPDPVYTISLHESGSIVSAPPVRPAHYEPKKIQPYNYILFESDFPDSPGFWKKYN
jgi:hypothetical protein